MPAHIKTGEQAIAKGWTWEHWEGNDQGDQAAKIVSRRQEPDEGMKFSHRRRFVLAQGGLAIIAAAQEA
eukprot:14332709-Heterocapsa_arctica.AAC.1